MAKPTVAELQLRLNVQGLHYVTSLREALKRVGGAEVRKQLDAQAKAILGIEDAAKKAGKATSGFGNFLKTAARGTIVAQGLYRGFKMVGGAIAASLEPLAEFEHNMMRVRAKGQLSAAEAKAAGNAVKALTGQTQYGPVEASEAAVGLAAAGRGKTLATDLPTMLRFAQANDVAPEKSTEILLGISGQMGMHKPEDLERIGDMVTKADQLSVLNVNEIYDTMKYVGPLARDAGVSLQSVLSMVVSLGDAGIKGSKAGTGLRNLLSAIAAPPRRAKQAQKQLDKIHLNQDDLRQGFEDIPKFLRDLEQRFEKYGIKGGERIAIEKIMFGQYGMTATSALLGDSGLNESGVSNITKNRNDIAATNHLMKEQADLMGGTLKNRLQQVNGQWELMKINIGEMNLPKVNEAVDALLRFMRGAEGQETAKKVGEISAALTKLLPPALTVATDSISAMVTVVGDIARKYAPKGTFGKDVKQMDVPDDTDTLEAVENKAIRDWLANAPGSEQYGSSMEAVAAAKAKFNKEKKIREHKEFLAGLTPEQRANYEKNRLLALKGQHYKETGRYDALTPPPASGPGTAAPGTGAKPHVPGELYVMVELSDELKAKLKLKQGQGDTFPFMALGNTSQ